MATGTIVSVSQSADATRVCIIASVPDGSGANTEFQVCIPNDDDFKALTNPQKKAALVSALKQSRDTQLASVQSIAGITGSITV